MIGEKEQHPKGGIVLGNLQELRRDPLGFFLSCSQNYGDLVPLRFGPKHAVLLAAPSLVQVVLETRASDFVKGPGENSLARVYGSGLLLNEGNDWQRRRDIASRAQDAEHIERFTASAVNLLKTRIDSWVQSGDIDIDIHAEMMQFTVEHMTKVLFDVDPDSEDGRRISGALHDLRRDAAGSLDTVLLSVPEIIPTARNRKLGSALRAFDETVYGLIRERREELTDRGDVLSALVLARDEAGDELSDTEIRDDLAAIFIGTEAVAITIAYALHAVAGHPPIEDDLAEEIRQRVDGRRPAVSDLDSMELLRRVIFETLRLYPPGYVIDRTSTRELELDGHRIAKGTTIFISPWAIHRDPRLYSDPETFDPARWTPEFLAELPPCAFIPFGSGPRRCYGELMGLRIIAAALATSLASLEIAPLSSDPLVFKAEALIRPQFPVRVSVRPRA
jgi:cytochrome P450